MRLFSLAALAATGATAFLGMGSRVLEEAQRINALNAKLALEVKAQIKKTFFFGIENVDTVGTDGLKSLVTQYPGLVRALNDVGQTALEALITNVKPDKVTPAQQRAVNILVDAGARFDLVHAVRLNHALPQSALLDKALAVSQDADRNPAFIEAIRLYNVGLAEKLVVAGANPLTICTKDGRTTCLEYARKANMREMADMLYKMMTQSLLTCAAPKLKAARPRPEA